VAWTLALAGMAAPGVLGCRRGGSSAGSTANGPKVVWSVELGTAANRFGLAVSPDGMIYVAGYVRPESPPAGYASAEGFWQTCLFEVDPQGQVTRRLGGSVTRGQQPEVWVEAASWGAGYAIDALGGIYGLLPAGRSRFNEAGRRLGGPITVGHDGRLFVGGPGGVHALELEAEEPARLFLSIGSSYAGAPALGADGTFYFQSGSRLVAASASGELLWQQRASGGRPAVSQDGRLYLVERTQLRAFATSGQAMWEFAAESPFGRSPAAAPDGSVYAVTQSGLLYCVENGQKRWSFPLERPIGSELSVDGAGTVYVADQLGKVYAVGADGRRRWSFALPASSGTPVPGPDGTVYVADSNGRLHAIAPPAGSE